MRLLIAAALLLAQETRPEDWPTVQVMSGKVAVWRATEDRVENIAKSVRVSPKDRIGTSGGEIARFATEGSVMVLLKGVKVAAGKGLSIERKGVRIALRLVDGTVVLESFEAEIELDTPGGRVTGKHVVLLVTAEGNSTKVVALEGSPTFSNSLGSVTVPEGSSSSSDGGKAPSPPKRGTEPEWIRTVEEPGNLLRNPGFEEGFAGWDKDDPPVALDRRIFRSGTASCRSELKRDTHSLPILAPRTLKGVFKPGSRYLVRFHVRTEGYARDGASTYLKAGVDRTGRVDWSETDHHFVFQPSEGRWASRRFMFEATGPDATIGIFGATERGMYTGTVWVDDFLVAEFPRK